MLPAPWRRLRSLRARLLWGILLPIAALIALNTYSLYQKALEVADIAYDRTLLATAKTIGEQITVTGYDEAAALHASILYSSLEAFESDNFSSLYYKVTDTKGRFISGYADLPVWHGRIAQKTRYAALVDFHNAAYDGRAVRMAVLLQPITGQKGRGMAVIQVAETLELREALAREVLAGTIVRQLLLLLVIAGVVIVIVQIATRPVRHLSQTIVERDASDLSPIEADNLSTELRPVVDATNSVMARLQALTRHQKRFVRDAAHQLRTPLAVLTTQVQSGLRGDAPPMQILKEIEATTKSATSLANQMLTLAKVEQLKHEALSELCIWADIVRELTLELSPLIAERELQFDMRVDTAGEARVRAHAWMLRELSRNLIHNAIKYTPEGGVLTIAMHLSSERISLLIENTSTKAVQTNATDPHSYTTDYSHAPSGLGLTICKEIVDSLNAHLDIESERCGKAYLVTVRVGLKVVV